MNPYSVLNLPIGATAEEIKSAYRREAMAYHPDRLEDENPEKFQAISEAYEMLTNGSWQDPAHSKLYELIDITLKGAAHGDQVENMRQMCHAVIKRINDAVGIMKRDQMTMLQKEGRISGLPEWDQCIRNAMLELDRQLDAKAAEIEVIEGVLERLTNASDTTPGAIFINQAR